MLDSPAHLPPLLSVLVIRKIRDLQVPLLELPAAVDHRLHVVGEAGLLRPAHGDDRIAQDEPLRGRFALFPQVDVLLAEGLDEHDHGRVCRSYVFVDDHRQALPEVVRKLRLDLGGLEV